MLKKLKIKIKDELLETELSLFIHLLGRPGRIVIFLNMWREDYHCPFKYVKLFSFSPNLPSNNANQFSIHKSQCNFVGSDIFNFDVHVLIYAFWLSVMQQVCFATNFQTRPLEIPSPLGIARLFGYIGVNSIQSISSSVVNAKPINPVSYPFQWEQFCVKCSRASNYKQLASVSMWTACRFKAN